MAGGIGGGIIDAGAMAGLRPVVRGAMGVAGGGGGRYVGGGYREGGCGCGGGGGGDRDRYRDGERRQREQSADGRNERGDAQSIRGAEPVRSAEMANRPIESVAAGAPSSMEG